MPASPSKKRPATDFLPKPVDTIADAVMAEVNTSLQSEEIEIPEVLDPAPTLETAPEPQVLVGDDLVKALMAEIAGLRKQVTSMAKEHAKIVEDNSDLTDDLWFISRPNGRHTTRKVFQRKGDRMVRVIVDDVRTSFIGPFDNEEQVRTYLKAKALKRPDSVIDWSVCDVMNGRDAREIQRREERNWQNIYGDNVDAQQNVLERRVASKFAEAQAAQKADMALPQGQGKITGEVTLPRVKVVKLADGTESLDIRDRA